MQTVDQMVSAIVRREGGYVNDRNDKGGPTNHGVSLYRYAKGKPELDLDGDGDIDADDIKLVTPELAMKLYKEDFFFQPGYDKLPADLQSPVFDMAVNAGAKRSTILLQRAVVALGQPLRSIDGALGPKTLAAIAAVVAEKGAKTLNNQFVAERIAFYEGLVARNSSQGRFLKGWKNRANEFLM